MSEFIAGNQAIARAAIVAGCDFFAGYPITPASSVLTEMTRALAHRVGRVVQTEDEIAAIGQCIGAAMAGAKPMTATSGPGISLYSENIGLAQMGEVPLVIVDCQRMGPATGGATATGEGDVMFARHVTAGGYPLPVLSATNAESAYLMTVEAFNIAERLRTPVILLTSKDIALTRQSVNLESIVLPPIVERSLDGGDGEFKPYAVAEMTDVPRFSPIGGKRRVRFTGSIHDENGVLTIDRKKIARKLTHLREKIEGNAVSLELTELDEQPDAEILIVSYGLADGAAKRAVTRLRTAGNRVSHLTLYSLHPVPRRAILSAAGPRIRRILVPELNIGLYVDEVRQIIRDASVESIVRYDGGLISPQVIFDRATTERCERGVVTEEGVSCS